MGSSGTQSYGQRLYPTPKPFRYTHPAGSIWVVEWYEPNGQYRINETPHKDVATYLFRGLGDTPGVTQARITEVRTVSEFKV